MHPSNQVWLRMDTMLTDKFECLAEEFAFWLLADLEEACAEGLDSAEQIAGYFNVPIEMILRRLH